MKESSKRMLSLLLAVILLLLSLFIFGSFVKPAFEDVNLLRAEVAASQDYLESQRKAKASFDGLFKDFSNASSIQNLLALALPGKEGITQSAYQVQALAGVNGVAINSMSVEVSMPEEKRASVSLIKGVGKIEVDMRGTSSYQSFRNFIASLESNIKLMNVKEMNIESATDGSGNLNYSLIIETYYQN